MKYILPPCGQSTDYPHFYILFQLAFRGKEPLETRTSVLQASSQHPCLSRLHGVFPKR